MPARIVLQPNGLFARFSTVVDDFTDVNMTRDEALELMRHEGNDLSATRKIETAERCPERFTEAIETIRTIHGQPAADAALAWGTTPGTDDLHTRERGLSLKEDKLMTRERALELADMLAGDFHQDLRGDIAETILAAVAEENEACTKIAEDLNPNNAIGPLFGAGIAAAIQHIAAKIRERGIPLKVGA